jgi:methylmalonyl-CoA mutase
MALGGMTRAVQAGVPQARITEAAARRQARIDRGIDILVGVNRYQETEREAVEIRSIDNERVRAEQVARLKELRSARDTREVQRTLAQLTEMARANAGNLLEGSIHAMRARATVGEVTAALEQVFGRYQAEPVGVTGVYTSVFADDDSWRVLAEQVAGFAERQGRQPRILIAKLGQDGHDRGAKTIAAGLSDLGFDVDLGPLFQTPAEVAQAAVDSDVHLLGISSQAGGHSTLVAQLMSELQKRGGKGILVVCGGIIPEQDQPGLLQLGVRLVFNPGETLPNIAQRLLDLLVEEHS